MNSEDLIECEICAEFDTGPLMLRPRPDLSTGTLLHDTDSKSYVKSLEFSDGWVLHWYNNRDFIAFCPYHARGITVPRPHVSKTVGNVTVDLQEFDFVGERREISHFKHVSTRRYLNLRSTHDGVLAGELLNGRWVSYPVSEGFARARSRTFRIAQISPGLRVYTDGGPATIRRPKVDSTRYWVVAYDSGDEDIFAETDMIIPQEELPPPNRHDSDD